MLNFTAMVFAASTVIAQAEAPPSNYEHLKPMEWLIGDWESSSVAQADMPGVAKKGDRVVMTSSTQWGLNKNVVFWHFTIDVNGARIVETWAINGWDAEKKQMVGFAFDSFGNHSQSRTVLGDRTETISQHFVESGGSVVNSTIIVNQTDPDTMSVRETRITRDGEPQPDKGPFEYKRVK